MRCSCRTISELFCVLFRIFGRVAFADGRRSSTPRTLNSTRSVCPVSGSPRCPTRESTARTTARQWTSRTSDDDAGCQFFCNSLDLYEPPPATGRLEDIMESRTRSDFSLAVQLSAALLSQVRIINANSSPLWFHKIVKCHNLLTFSGVKYIQISRYHWWTRSYICKWNVPGKLYPRHELLYRMRWQSNDHCCNAFLLKTRIWAYDYTRLSRAYDEYEWYNTYGLSQ